MLVTGPHNASLTVTPPSTGGPFAHYDVAACLSTSPSDCFTARCTPSGPGACMVAVGAAECLPPATNCLRAETSYTLTATASKQDGTKSLPSAPPTVVTTPSHR